MDAPLWIALSWVAVRALGMRTRRIALEMVSTAVLVATGGWTWLHLDHRAVQSIGTWAVGLGSGAAKPVAWGQPRNHLPSLSDSAAFVAGGLTILLASLLIASAIHVALGIMERPVTTVLRPNRLGAFLSFAGYTAIYYGLWETASRLSHDPQFAALLPWVKGSLWSVLAGALPVPHG